MRQLAFVVPIVLLVAPLRAQQVEPVIDPAIDSLARAVVGSATPGLALAVLHDGRVVHRATYGVVAPGGAAVDVHTPFYIASTAKMFTAMAVLTLVDEGRVALDHRVARYLPDEVPAYARDVTVRQLLDHTSGLIDHYDVGGEDRSYTNDDVLAILAGADSLRFAPGTRASYSNSGYTLLALLVERVSGGSFASYLERRFFEPFGMRDAFVAATTERPAMRAIGHRPADGIFETWDYDGATTATGAGGVYASLADMEAWHRALRGGRVVGDSLLDLASRPPALPGGRLTPFGMGWLAEFAARGPLADRWYAFAFGSLRGFRSVYQWFRDDDFALVWMSNSAGDDVMDTLHAIPALVLTGTRP